MSDSNRPIDPAAEAHLPPENFRAVARSLHLEVHEFDCASESEMDFAGLVWTYATALNGLAKARRAWLQVAGRSSPAELGGYLDDVRWMSISLRERERLADALLEVRQISKAIDEATFHRNAARGVVKS